MEAGNQLNISGQVSTAGDLYKGRKNTNSCLNNPVRVIDPDSLEALPNCSGRTLIPESSLGPWNGMIQVGVDKVVVPSPEEIDPIESAPYFNHAELRLALKLNASGNVDTSNSSTGVEVRDRDNSLMGVQTTNLDACAGGVSGKAVGNSSTLYNNREGSYIKMLEIDLAGLLACAHNQDLFVDGRGLDDETNGGLVFHLTVDGPNSGVGATTKNNYGVRIRNGQQLQANAAQAPTAPYIEKGLTVVSDQALYLQGNYNSVDKRPAAVIADSFQVLSNNWSDANSALSVNSRAASNTIYNVAVLSGTDTTGGLEGAGGQGGAYNGGLENYPRMHENWSGDTLTYLGSFVSLGQPRHYDGTWIYGNPQYTAPARDWGYDTDFNDSSKLPPHSPRFVALRQELFVRDYQ